MDDLRLTTTSATIVKAPVKTRPSPLADEVFALIKRRLPLASEPLGQAALHHFHLPGKMLRARMALATAAALGINRQVAVFWAASVEVLHNASLIHDDISDGDECRRDRPSIWAAFGRDTALALGDWLIGLAFELASEAACRSRSPRLVQVLSRHMLDTTSGQAMEFECHNYPDWDGYTAITSGKTAPLFIAPVEGMAVVAGREEIINPVTAYFSAVGVAYQIANDILNILGEDGAENPASDLIRRAPNAVIVLYRTLLVGEQSRQFENWLASEDNRQASSWHRRITASSAVVATAEVMQGIVDEAERQVSSIPSEIAQVVAPVQALLASVCEQSCRSINS